MSIITQWVEELESGHYEQRKDVLKGNGKYCCLGVLCDAVLKLDQEEKLVDGERISSFEGQECVVPVNWLPEGYKNDSDPILKIPPHLKEPHMQLHSFTCTELNDQQNFTFAEIAQCIRFTFPEEFEVS